MLFSWLILGVFIGLADRYVRSRMMSLLALSSVGAILGDQLREAVLYRMVGDADTSLILMFHLCAFFLSALFTRLALKRVERFDAARSAAVTAEGS